MPIGEKAWNKGESKWNGRLNEAFEMLHQTLDSIFGDITTYKDLDELSGRRHKSDV